MLRMLPGEQVGSAAINRVCAVAVLTPTVGMQARAQSVRLAEKLAEVVRNAVERVGVNGANRLVNQLGLPGHAAVFAGAVRAVAQDRAGRVCAVAVDVRGVARTGGAARDDRPYAPP